MNSKSGQNKLEKGGLTKRIRPGDADQAGTPVKGSCWSY